MQIIQNRRRFLAGAAAAGAAGLIGTSTPALAEPPPETTTVRLPRWIGGAYCWAGAVHRRGAAACRGLHRRPLRARRQQRRPIGVDRTR